MAAIAVPKGRRAQPDVLAQITYLAGTRNVPVYGTGRRQVVNTSFKAGDIVTSDLWEVGKTAEVVFVDIFGGVHLKGRPGHYNAKILRLVERK